MLLGYRTCMIDFDAALLDFVNRFAQRSWTFDSLVVLISYTHLAKGFLVLPLFWWAWFHKAKKQDDVQRTVILTLVAGLIAVAVSRLLQIALPYRARPIHTADLHFTAPYSFPAGLLSDWSSFPSDHACLFFALATGLCFISRWIGVVALLHAGLIISLPRVYLGLHFPTDILSGALLGIAVMYSLWSSRSTWRIVVDPVLAWSRKSPETFFPCVFLLTAEMARLFEDTRALSQSLWHIAKAFSQRY